MARRLDWCALWVIGLGLLAWPTAARAQSDSSSLELAWRWAASPVAAEGPRVLDLLELGGRIHVRGQWSLYPHLGYGVSYGRPWYMLGALGLETVWSPARDGGFVPRLAFGLALLGEGISREGQRVFRDSFAYDAAITARGGADYWFRRFGIGFDLRIAVAPLGHLEVHGPLDVGVALRAGVRFPGPP